MRSALLLCVCFADEGRYEHLLRRRSGDWFPHIPSRREYWIELSEKDLFLGTTGPKLKTQMTSLLRDLIEYSAGRTPSRRDQPSKEFSVIQNRSLIGEIFRVPDSVPVSPRSFDLVRLSAVLTRSELFSKGSKMGPTDVGKWRIGLTRLLPIDCAIHNVSRRDPPTIPTLIGNSGLAQFT